MRGIQKHAVMLAHAVQDFKLIEDAGFSILVVDASYKNMEHK
jgi:hypothetical protein